MGGTASPSHTTHSVTSSVLLLPSLHSLSLLMGANSVRRPDCGSSGSYPLGCNGVHFESGTGTGCSGRAAGDSGLEPPAPMRHRPCGCQGGNLSVVAAEPLAAVPTDCSSSFDRCGCCCHLSSAAAAAAVCFPTASAVPPDGARPPSAPNSVCIDVPLILDRLLLSPELRPIQTTLLLLTSTVGPERRAKGL